MSDKITVKVHASTNLIGSKVETTVTFDREEWEDMGEKEKDDLFLEIMTTNLIEWGWEEI